MRALALLPFAALIACGPPAPPTPAQIEAQCQDRAAAAAAPTGQVAVGVSNTRGVQTGISLGVSGDFLRGRDPAEVYADCYNRLTGGQSPAPAVSMGVGVVR